jgi:hypothetical protein
MRREARFAFQALQKINAPVYDRREYGAHFIIGAELRTSEDSYFADYYQEEIREHWHPEDLSKPIRERRIVNSNGVRQDVIDILARHGLYFEWINPGMGGVYSK